MRKKTGLLLGAAATIALGALGANAFGQGAAGAFTTAQANDGRAMYDAACAGCHLPDLSGTNDAPALGGTAFLGAWGKRTTAQLYSKIATTMPLGSGGSLSEKQYTDITAYILERNGARRLLVHVKAVHPFLAFDRVWMIRPQHALPACEGFAQQPCSRLALVHVGQERREIVHGR